jgi:predicted metalloprotease
VVRTRPGLSRVAAAVLLVLGTLAGCTTVPGTPQAAVTVGLSPPGVALTQAPDVVSAPAAEQVAGILADLEDFWRSRIGGRFTPLKAGYALIDSADRVKTPAALCATGSAGLTGNAYYCPSQDGIVIDAAALVPVLLQHYGTGGLAASLAHEFGHAIQARIGPTAEQQQADPQRYPQILIEAQADCSAGAFLQWVVDGKSSRLRLPAVLLNPSVAPLLDFRDPADGTANDSLAHGLGLDRLRFVLTGMRGGTDACHAMTTDDLHLTLGRPGTRQQPSARYPDPAAVAAAARESVRRWNPGGSPRLSITAPAAAAELAAAAPYGQFAEATATVLAIGRSRFPAGPGAACFTGAWTASVFGHAAAGELGSWPGDADEAMDLILHRPNSRFADLAGFADGFDKGPTACG